MSFQNHVLSTPVWKALTGSQREFSLGTEPLLRYHPDVLPFAAVPKNDTVVEADIALAHGPVFFCDALPTVRGGGNIESCFRVVQMMFRGEPSANGARPDEVELARPDDEEMLGLTDVAFPGLFRLHTGRLGRYLGIRHEGLLVAMAGERFRFDGQREISAVCTRPGFTGRGLASHLIRRLLHPGVEPAFLHVTESNTHALELYTRLGFAHTRTVDVMKVERKA